MATRAGCFWHGVVFAILALAAGGVAAECPGPTTIRTGLGPTEVPYLVLAPSGIAFGSQQALLVNEFNRRALERANDYCRPCVAEYTDATTANIRYRVAPIAGWTELTIIPTGGRPQKLPPNTTKRHGYIEPPSPNVTCREPPRLPPPPQPPKPTEPLPPPPDRPPPPTCRQPVNFRIPTGTLLAENSWAVPPGVTGQPPYAAIDAWVQNTYPGTRDAVLQGFVNQLQRECNRINPGRRCVARLEDITDADITVTQGEQGVPFLVGSNYIWRAKLNREIKGNCDPE